VTFDKWKLVVSVTIEGATEYYAKVGGFIAIFDMTRDFRLLCTKYIAHYCQDYVKMACLPNGSIIVDNWYAKENFWNLLS